MMMYSNYTNMLEISLKPMTINRVNIMRKLHGYAKDVFEIDDPHPLLHQLAVAEFDVESMSHCSDMELWMLLHKLKSNDVNWQKIEDLGATRLPQMSVKQKSLVKKLQKELGWSDEYMTELVINRYGYLDWQYLTGRKAFAFVNYLIQRNRQKSKKKKERK